MSIESGGKSNEWISRKDLTDCDVEGAFDIDSITYVPPIFEFEHVIEL